MKYSVITTPLFKKEAKKLLNRYASLKVELTALENSLQQNPFQGIPLGHSAFKIRLAIKSKGKGKSGGARIITYVVSTEQEIFLLSIYDKSDFETIDYKKLRLLIAVLRGRKSI